ncbi:MAG: hypothetical protein PHU56_02575 [Candidatus Pacebacteria bacterium]|nr:hypothetical protein [Candidatus Paceibacterota bacterium]
MTKQLVGWILLAVGVLTIIGGLWQTYQIFTAKAPFPEIFKLDKAQETFLPETPAQTQDELASRQIERLLQEQLGKIIPADTVSKLLNLTVWSIFMGILVLAAGKIATIGITLLKS